VRLSIDARVCQAYGVCAKSAPGFVSLDEDGEPVVADREVDADGSASAKLAEASCPVGAIRFE
jgi:ferredoxin